MNPKTPTGLEPDPAVHPAPPKDVKIPPPPPSPKQGSSRGWIWFLLLVAAAGAGYYYWSRGNGASAGSTAAAEGKGGKKGRGGGGPPPVVGVHAKRGSIGVYVTGPGNVIPIYTVVEKTRVDGQLMDVHYKEGDLVQKGQELLEIDPRPYQVALEQAEGQKARDEALLANAKVDQARYETLLKQNAIPEQQLTTQKALVQQYEGVVKTDQGLIDNAKLNIDYCHITAQITGRVGLRLVDPGNIVHASDANGLLVITQMEPISIIFPISETDLPAVRQRFRAGQTLPVEAWDPDSKKQIARGTLATIDNQIDQTTGTVKLRAEFDNKDNALFPNQMINARLLVQLKQGVVLLPSAAIQRTTQGTFVWLLKPDNTVTVQSVTEGTVEGEMSEIASGLNAGDAVIMTGVDKLNEGSRVNASFQEGGRGGGGQGAGPGGVQTPGQSTPGSGKRGGRKGGGKSTQ